MISRIRPARTTDRTGTRLEMDRGVPGRLGSRVDHDQLEPAVWARFRRRAGFAWGPPLIATKDIRADQHPRVRLVEDVAACQPGPWAAAAISARLVDGPAAEAEPEAERIQAVATDAVWGSW